MVTSNETVSLDVCEFCLEIYLVISKYVKKHSHAGCSL